ncbi:MAG: glycosyltransferase family 9 protein [bacterium]|nr:glycosyltransferase family 9 protein [bacterium]
MAMSKPNAILVIRFSSLGDCLLLGPVLRGLRKRFPSHRILWLTKQLNRDIWEQSFVVDDVIVWDGNDESILKKLQTEYAIEYTLDLQASPRSRRFTKKFRTSHQTEAAPPRLRRFLQIHLRGEWLQAEEPVPLRYLSAAKLWGVADDGLGLQLPVDESELRSLQVLPGYGTWVGIAPGAKHFTKRWPSEYYIALAKRLQESGVSILWIIGPEEANWLSLLDSELPGWQTRHAVTYPFYSIKKLIAAVSVCKAVVTNDSAVMHIAAGTHRPGIALFGPTIQQFGFAPFRSKLEVVEQSLDCRPCSAHGTPECPLGHHRCMRDVSVDNVWRRLQLFL